MFIKTTENTQELIDASRLYFAKRSYASFLGQYMKGKDDLITVKHLDHVMSLIEVLEISKLIKGLNITTVGNKLRSIIGPLTNKGANQVPPMEIITRELVFAPDGVYGLGEAFYDKDVLTRMEGCPQGSLSRLNTVMASTLSDEIQGETSTDTILANL